MSIKKLTTEPTEADFEARIRVAISHAFPWLAPGAIKHQTKFSVRLGRKSVDVESRPNEARADIILYSDTRPLAVLELKRNGVALSTADEEQGLCYAKLMSPFAPLTVISNGDETRVLNTLTGVAWAPDTTDEKTLANLFSNVGKIATSQVTEAVTTLLGGDSKAWVSALNAVTREQLAELTGDLADAQLPFGREFLISRQATDECLDLLKKGHRLVVLSGAPLSGKSNVLREICQKVETEYAMAVLFVEADHGGGIIQRIADALDKSLDWSISRDETRRWLRKRSESPGANLVVLVDNVPSGDHVLRKEIEDLTSNYFGARVQVVLALHENAAEAMQASQNWLTQSPLGRAAVSVTVGALADVEFESAQEAFRGIGMVFALGAKHSTELREPWVLRALASMAAAHRSQTELIEDGQYLQIPPMVGVDVINHARSRFLNSELTRLYQCMATAVMTDARDASRDPSLLLSSIHTFMVRRKTLTQIMHHLDVEKLIQLGFIREFRHSTGVQMLYVRLPELVASELALLVADSLSELDPDQPKLYLGEIEFYASLLPMGDIIVAQAIFDAATKKPDIIGEIVDIVLQNPIQQVPVLGVKFAMIMPDGKHGTLTISEDGCVMLTRDGKTRRLKGIDPSEVSCTYSNLYAWIVLAQIVYHYMHTLDEEVEAPEVHSTLLEVCKAPAPLRKPNLDYASFGIQTLETPTGVSLTLPGQGFLDSATYALLLMFSRRSLQAGAWIDIAADSGCVHLLNRIITALVELTHTTDTASAEWAYDTLHTRLYPALKQWLGANGMPSTE
ncbi:type I restriction enzyme HsdR N-terminal domain-containing protein [Pseudomonas sichuanensis]|uniref:type I restriction enzyme HsdR N-terminal domain-containing protein n=1 Tax=Pseudomonas sichuanensis TaxID=2213015 RepID=UPI00216092FA|nr:type I restriction enzyme HsdR N-terminal domain-containing protein [Pseudomonas sichuanensis]UVL91807.1 type I restriction enzyme HsdR N-terminal domain-containing protein [Pseudomonas sichuanensis]